MKSKVDACIFCGQVPCVCNAKPAAVKVTKRPPKPKAEEPDIAPEPVRKTSHLAAMSAAAQAAPARPTVGPERPVMTRMDTSMTEEEVVWQAAIRNLAPLMSEADREQYRGIITSEPHPNEAAIMWRARHAMEREEDGHE